MLDCIAKVDSQLKGYATVMSEQALADAGAALQEIQAGRYRGPLHGVPIAIKDLCYTQGVRTMGGTGVLKNFVAAFDSTVVAKLRTAGAVVLGKLNLRKEPQPGTTLRSMSRSTRGAPIDGRVCRPAGQE